MSEAGGEVSLEEGSGASNCDKSDSNDTCDNPTVMKGTNESNDNNTMDQLKQDGHEDSIDLKALIEAKSSSNDINLLSQVSNIDCSTSASIEERESIASSMTGCTVVMRVGQTEPEVDSRKFDMSSELSHGEEEKEDVTTNQPSGQVEDGKQILSAQELLQKTNHCPLQDQQSQAGESSSEREEKICDDNSLVEIDLNDTEADTHCESIVGRVCCRELDKQEQEYCSHIRANTCPIANSISTSLPEADHHRLNGGVCGHQQTSHQMLPVPVTGDPCRTSAGRAGVVNTIQMNCYDHHNHTSSRVNMADCDETIVRDFCNAPTKMVFTSQRMKEYFENFKSRRGSDRIRLYQFFKSTRTELVACLLLSLIVSQAQIVSKTQIQRIIADDWPVTGNSDGIDNNNKRHTMAVVSTTANNNETDGMDGNSKLGLVHFANGIVYAFTVASLTQVFGHVSGCHLVPSVSIAMYFKGYLSRARLVSYLVAQSIGPLLGIALLSALTSSQITSNDYRAIVSPPAPPTSANNNSQLDSSGSVSVAPSSLQPIISTQSSWAAETGLHPRVRRRRHAIVGAGASGGGGGDDDSNGTISSVLESPRRGPALDPVRTNDGAGRDDDDEHLLQQQQQQQQQQLDAGKKTGSSSSSSLVDSDGSGSASSETILLSIEDEQKRQLQLKRRQLELQLQRRASEEGAPSAGAGAVAVAVAPNAGSGGAEGSGGAGKTISGSSVGGGTYTSFAHGNTNSTPTTTTSAHTPAAELGPRTLDSAVADPSSGRSVSAPSRIQYISPSSDGPARMDDGQSGPETKMNVVVAEQVGDLQSDKKLAAFERRSANTTDLLPSSSNGIGIDLNGASPPSAEQVAKLRRRKRNRLQQQPSINSVDPSKDTYSNNNNKEDGSVISNGNNNNNNWKSLRWLQQPAPPPLLPAISPTRGQNAATGNGQQQAGGGEGGSSSSREHYINLLEFALPDKVMSSDSIRQCIDKQQRLSSNVGHEQITTIQKDTGKSNQLAASTPSTSVPNPSYNNNNYNHGLVASKSFYRCVLLSNGSQMFILQLIGTVIIVLTYLVNIDPRRDDLGFKSFSIGLSYFVACILTATSGGFYGNPFHLISLSWLSTTSHHWQSEWYIYLLTPLIGGLFGAMSHEYIDYTSARNCNKGLHLRRSFYSLDTLPTTAAADSATATAGPTSSSPNDPQAGGHLQMQLHQQQRQRPLPATTSAVRRANGMQQHNGVILTTTATTSGDDDVASIGGFSCASSRINGSPGGSGTGGSADHRCGASAAGNNRRRGNDDAHRQLMMSSARANSCNGSKTTALSDSGHGNGSGNCNGSAGAGITNRKLGHHYAKELGMERKRLMDNWSQQQQLQQQQQQQQQQHSRTIAAMGHCNGLNPLGPTAAVRRSNCCNGFGKPSDADTNSSNGNNNNRRYSDYDTNFLISQPVNAAGSNGNLEGKAGLANCMALMSSTMRRPNQLALSSSSSASYNASYM